MEDFTGFDDEIQAAADAMANIRIAVADYLTVGSVEGLRDLLETAINDTL